MAQPKVNPPQTQMVTEVYNQLNKDTSFMCQLNAGDQRAEVKAIWDDLPMDIKNRYYGSGVNVPEKLEGKRILDIGSGSGSLVFILAKLVGPTGYVIGIDVTEGLIETARAHSQSWVKQLGYGKPNFEFKLVNCETMNLKEDFGGEQFDIIVSNGVFCLVPGKKAGLQNAFSLLKEGGQFYLNDVYSEREPSEECKQNKTLWTLGVAGSMPWQQVTPTLTSIGFTTPYLTCASPVKIAKDEFNTMFGHIRFACSGIRLFKLGQSATKKEASRVTYNGNMKEYPQAFPWDINLTFPKGQGVDIDGALATILFNTYLRDSFSFDKAGSNPNTNKNQNPFAYMDELEKQGKLPAPIYKVD